MNLDLAKEIIAALANPQVILGLWLLCGMLFQSAMLMRASRDKQSTFDLVDVVRGTDRRASAAKVVQMICLEACVWAFVLYAIQGKLDQLGIYWFGMLLVGIGSPVVNKMADAVVSKWAGIAPEPAVQTPATVTTTTKTEVKT